MTQYLESSGRTLIYSYVKDLAVVMTTGERITLYGYELYKKRVEHFIHDHLQAKLSSPSLVANPMNHYEKTSPQFNESLYTRTGG